MTETPRPEPARKPAGRDAAWSPAWSLLAIAAGLVVGAIVWWWWPAASPEVAEASPPVAALPMAAPVPAAPPAVTPASAPVVAAAAATAVPLPPAPRVGRNRDPNGDLTPDLSDYVNEGEKPSMNEVIDRLHRAGVRDGLGAFPAPGTRPPLVGLAVPEDFVLPDGYVRHYQATDDGQRIEAILMFAPDRQFFDAAGRVVSVPKDRVVPPELAPPGLPLRRIAIPAALDTGKPGS